MAAAPSGARLGPGRPRAGPRTQWPRSRVEEAGGTCPDGAPTPAESPLRLPVRCRLGPRKALENRRICLPRPGGIANQPAGIVRLRTLGTRSARPDSPTARRGKAGAAHGVCRFRARSSSRLILLRFDSRNHRGAQGRSTAAIGRVIPVPPRPCVADRRAWPGRDHAAKGGSRGRIGAGRGRPASPDAGRTRARAQSERDRSRPAANAEDRCAARRGSGRLRSTRTAERSRRGSSPSSMNGKTPRGSKRGRIRR